MNTQYAKLAELLEPGAKLGVGLNHEMMGLAYVSQAISLKRIADALERLAEIERTLATPIAISINDVEPHA